MSALPENPFWMVYGIDQGPPIKRHESRAKAAAEMQRLARAYPGKVFVLLESVGAAVKDDVKTVVYGGRDPGYCDPRAIIDDDVPF